MMSRAAAAAELGVEVTASEEVIRSAFKVSAIPFLFILNGEHRQLITFTVAEASL